MTGTSGISWVNARVIKCPLGHYICAHYICAHGNAKWYNHFEKESKSCFLIEVKDVHDII